MVVPPSVSQDMSRILNNKARRAAIPGFYKVSTCTLHGVLQSFLFYALAAGMLYCTYRLEHDSYRLEYGIYWPSIAPHILGGFPTATVAPYLLLTALRT